MHTSTDDAKEFNIKIDVGLLQQTHLHVMYACALKSPVPLI